MRFVRPRHLLAGFRADGPDADLPCLAQLGEHWAPQGWRVGPHAHRGWELYLQAEGASTWECGRERHRLSAGQGYLVAPGVIHRSLHFSRAEQHFYFVELDATPFLAPLDRQAGAAFQSNRFTPLADAAPLKALFRSLVREVSLERPMRAAALHHLLGLMVLETARLLAPAQNPAPPPPAFPASHPGIAQARELLENQPGHRWRLDELARLVGLSPNYLCARFRREYGVSPLRFLADVRIEQARDLLRHSDLSLADIAGELGYASSQHFATRFGRATGLSPSQWRRRK